MLLALAALGTLGATSCAPARDRAGSADGDARGTAAPPAAPSRAIVASYYPAGAAAGIAVLRAGGNAFDAFVATTFADYVVAPGVTSLAGPLGAVTWDARKKEAQYLDATYDDPSGPDAIHHPGDPASGKGVLVPGAVAGLYALSQRYGRLPFAEVVRPAAQLARDGFVVDAYYAALVDWRKDRLGLSADGQRTFFRDGRPLREGERLVQPELADLLDRLGRDGAAAFYRGDFARRFIAEVAAHGGRMSEDDLARYEARWLTPVATKYRGFDVIGTAGRTSGGLQTLLSLGVLAHHQFDTSKHYAESSADLEALVRTSRTMPDEAWLHDPRVLDDPRAVAEQLTDTHTAEIWARITSPGNTPKPHAGRGAHSSAVAIIDSDGNAIAGTHTINDLPWGEGMFVDGVPLNASGLLDDFNSVAPGQRRVMPLSMHLVVEEGRVRSASSAFDSSLLEAEMQFLVNLVDYRLPVAEAATRPRFGTYPFDATNLESHADIDKNWLDPRVSRAVVDDLATKGLLFVQEENADLGLGAIASQEADGTLRGAIAPAYGVEAGSVQEFVRDP